MDVILCKVIYCKHHDNNSAFGMTEDYKYILCRLRKMLNKYVIKDAKEKESFVSVYEGKSCTYKISLSKLMREKKS